MRYADATPDDLIRDMADLHPHIRLTAITTCARAAEYRCPPEMGIQVKVSWGWGDSYPASKVIFRRKKIYEEKVSWGWGDSYPASKVIFRRKQIYEETACSLNWGHRPHKCRVIIVTSSGQTFKHEACARVLVTCLYAIHLFYID